MGWSEAVYFNVFYAVVAVLVVTGVVSLLLWLGAGIEQFSSWLARVFSPKAAPDPGAEALGAFPDQGDSGQARGPVDRQAGRLPDQAGSPVTGELPVPQGSTGRGCQD